MTCTDGTERKINRVARPTAFILTTTLISEHRGTLYIRPSEAASLPTSHPLPGPTFIRSPPRSHPPAPLLLSPILSIPPRPVRPIQAAPAALPFPNSSVPISTTSAPPIGSSTTSVYIRRYSSATWHCHTGRAELSGTRTVTSNTVM